MNLRKLICHLLTEITDEGRSLSEQVSELNSLPANDRALGRELLSGTIRHFYSLQFMASELLEKPLKRKDTDIQMLLLLGLYQLFQTRIPSHAAIHETVEVAALLNKSWAKGLLNAVLRRAEKEQQRLENKVANNKPVASNLPRWLYDQLKRSWPEQLEFIIENSNSRAPIYLRANTHTTSTEALLTALENADVEATHYGAQCIRLSQGVDISGLPGYKEGHFSVQDFSAQYAAELLSPSKGMRVLDACAAPGGKTAHLLEYSGNSIELQAIDNHIDRLKRVTENLHRLKLDNPSVMLTCEDASTVSWPSDKQFDRILLDAPCSATGVIRRHPDIKLHRRQSDIQNLIKLQVSILDNLWQHLKPGGLMLYATCSIIPAENSEQTKAFLSRHQDAKLCQIKPDSTYIDPVEYGWQILPGEKGGDGFYYALLQKLE